MQHDVLHNEIETLVCSAQKAALGSTEAERLRRLVRQLAVAERVAGRAEIEGRIKDLTNRLQVMQAEIAGGKNGGGVHIG